MDTTSNNIGAGFALLKSIPDASGRPALGAVIERIRRRWRLRLLLHGLLWTLVLGLGVFVSAAWLVNAMHFDPNALWVLRFVTLFSLLALVAWFCIRPLRRDADDLRVALYLEEHEPELKSILLGAVDARRGDDPERSTQLVEELEARALEACAQIEFGDRVEREPLRRAAGRLGLVFLVMLTLALWPPAFLRSGAPALLQAWASASEVSPYRIELVPGDVEIARGADQAIRVTIDGFDGDDVRLSSSTDGGENWTDNEMTATALGRFQGFLFDVPADTDYYVTGAGRETRVYRLSVADIPAVESIGLRYYFPAYTMLPPQSVDNTGDIEALRGTRVEVRILPTSEIPGGALQLGDGQRIELARDDAGAWIGEISVRDDDVYQVILQRRSGVPVEILPEYRIVALDDQYPRVSITSPGRDTKVSMIEEPVLRVRASDDQGIDRLELVLSINGADEQRITLLPAQLEPDSAQQVEAEHVVYLEDLGLQPGDMISYYVSAAERAPDAAGRTATSDMFFYQVRPFSNNYRRAQQGGSAGGGGGAGGQQQGQLSEQQKQFVIATFKMMRDRATFSDETWQDNLELLVTAQSRIRDRVEAIVRRLKLRPLVHTDERYRVILDELPRAVEAMHEVEKQLGEAEVEPALTDAQIALTHLQRADAVFRDIDVALGNQGGGGGGGAQASEDLANLFQLEMDKLRHQYDTVQRDGQRQRAPDQVIDETLEKLRELARRQQQQVERMLRRQGQAQSGNASSEQLALAEQLEELARQLERLSREQPNRDLSRSARQMREAAAAMRQAAAEAGTNGSGSVESARQAAENLREAQRLLDRGRVRQFSEEVERSLRRAELAERKQAEIQREVAAFDTGRDERFEQRLNRLEQKKRSLAKALNELEDELGELATTAKDEQPKAGQSLRQAIRDAHENRLQDRIGRTRQMLRQDNRGLAEDNEAEIRKSIAQLREQIESALAGIDERGARGMARSLEELQELARELRSIRDRRARAEANQPGANGEPARADADGDSNRADAGGNPNRGDTRGDANYRGAAGGSNFFDGHSGGIVQPREVEDIVKRARRVTESLVEENRLQPGEIDPLLANLEALAQDPNNAPPAAHDLALRALMELEFRLRNEHETPDAPDPLVAEPTEIPDEYRDLIADYFRNLSKE
jgi:hypothetical protein